MCVQPGAMKLVLGRHWMHVTRIHSVMSEDQFHCTRLYLLDDHDVLARTNTETEIKLFRNAQWSCGKWNCLWAKTHFWINWMFVLIGKPPIGALTAYSLVQWNWFSDVTWCTWATCIQWRQRTNFTAPDCTYEVLKIFRDVSAVKPDLQGWELGMAKLDQNSSLFDQQNVLACW